MKERYTSGEELAALRRFFDDTCREAGIVPDTDQHTDMAERVMVFWNAGLELDAIKQILFPPIDRNNRL